MTHNQKSGDRPPPRSISIPESFSQSYRSYDESDTKSQFSGASFYKDEEKYKKEGEQEQKAKPCKKCFSWFESFSEIDPTNLTFSFDPGCWDHWGVYYCSSRYGRHTKFNSKYFSIAAIIAIGQSDFFNLIHLMYENGGAVFLIIVFLVYISFGYLNYLLQTIVGQYSGRKPLMMIRLMAPAFAGLGIGLYIRTLFRTIVLISVFSNCLIAFFDLLFCKAHKSPLLKRLVWEERDQTTFRPLCGLSHPLMTATSDLEFHLDKVMITLCSCSVFLCYAKLKDFGAGMTVMLRLILLFLAGYTTSGYLQINPTVSSVSSMAPPITSLAYLPLRVVFKANWLKLIDGNAWVAAMIFVMSSLELGTIVHPYLGSKSFFHYRFTRDGMYLVLVAYIWNILGVVAVLLWLGYVGINKKEIMASLEEIDGYYGMFIVFSMKHLQAEMTMELESDILFFCCIFYFIIGLSALLATICYLYIVVDCSYPESGHGLMKFFVMCWFMLFFGFIIFPVMTSNNGVRHLIWLNHYGCDAWSGFFLIFCFILAVISGHGMGRVLHDFYNIIHLQGYQVMTHYHQIPAIVVIIFCVYPIFALITKTYSRLPLHQGPTDWDHPATIILGYFFAAAPVLATIIGALIHLKTRKHTLEHAFKPRRDFYQNKHHICVCFKDYQNFDLDKLPEFVQAKIPRRGSSTSAVVD